jgi:hypothetical protein
VAVHHVRHPGVDEEGEGERVAVVQDEVADGGRGEQARDGEEVGDRVDVLVRVEGGQARLEVAARLLVGLRRRRGEQRLEAGTLARICLDRGGLTGVHWQNATAAEDGVQKVVYPAEWRPGKAGGEFRSSPSVPGLVGDRSTIYVEGDVREDGCWFSGRA